jgi:DNA-binding LacI/PurR family transcriptional regulator
MNISHQNIDPVLKKIDVNKLLILGMGNPVDCRMNFLLQDFGQSVQQCLGESLDRLKKYDEMILVYEQKSTAHPADTVPAVREFCKKHQLGFRNSHRFNEAEVKTGQVWFVIRDTDLVQVIKACVAKKLVPGEDVGIISYNDTPMKEIVEGGVTVISTDFKKMGEMAADFVINKQKLAEILSTKLIVRKSL